MRQQLPGDAHAIEPQSRTDYFRRKLSVRWFGWDGKSESAFYLFPENAVNFENVGIRIADLIQWLHQQHQNNRVCVDEGGTGLQVYSPTGAVPQYIEIGGEPE